MKIKHYFFSLFILFCKLTFAQYNQLEFDYIKTEDGLPHSTVNDILQDSLGYIWIATDDGVASYDNYNIKVYRQKNNHENVIANNQALKLHVDPQNRLWVGTKESLELYNEKTRKFKHFCIYKKASEEPVSVVDIFQENRNMLLLGTDGGGLRCFNTLDNTSGFFLPEEIQHTVGNRVSSILKDKYGRFWIATFDQGVFLYNPDCTSEENPQKQLRNFLKNTEIRKVFLLSPEQLLVGTYGKGIISIDIDSLSVSDFLPGNEVVNSAKRIFQIAKCDSLLYIGSDGEGLITVDLLSLNTAHYKNCGHDFRSIRNNVIRSIYIDREKGLWFGHYQGGISHVGRKKKFQHINVASDCKLSLSYSNVTSILNDKDNNLWIGTDGGGINIVKNKEVYNGHNHNLSKIYSGPNPKNILCLFEDKDENIWVGTYLEGVFIFNPQTRKLRTLKEVYPNIQLSNSDVRSIMQDRTGKIWIATNGGGINIINPETKENEILRRNDSLPSRSLSLDWVRFIHEDSYGFIWIGTAYGLNLYDPVEGTFQHFFYDKEDNTSISNNFSYCFAEDVNHQIWIGTAFGLNKYDRKTRKFKVYTESDGLPGSIINSIIDTKDGNLWISTNNGISRFNLQENNFTNYNYTDGLASNSFINNSFYNQNNQELYFGSISGVVYFRPEEIKEIDYDIPVLLTDFKIFNQSVQAGALFDNREILKENIEKTKSVEILKRDNAISVEFTA